MKSIEAILTVWIKVYVLILLVLLSVVLGDLYYNQDEWKPREVQEIRFEGFQDDWNIEVHQVLHTNGVAYYLDKNGDVVLARPERKSGRDFLKP